MMDEAMNLAASYFSELVGFYEEGRAEYERLKLAEENELQQQEIERLAGWQKFWVAVRSHLPDEVQEYLVIHGEEYENSICYNYQPKYVRIQIPGHAPIVFQVTGKGTSIINGPHGQVFFVLTDIIRDFTDWEEKDIPDRGFVFTNRKSEGFEKLSIAIYFARRCWLEAYEETDSIREKLKQQQPIQPETYLGLKKEPVYEDMDEDLPEVRGVQLIDVFSPPLFEDLVELIRGIVREVIEE